MKKKDYVAPSMEVVEMEMQGSLLAGSETRTGNSPEDGTMSEFQDVWE